MFDVFFQELSKVGERILFRLANWVHRCCGIMSRNYQMLKKLSAYCHSVMSYHGSWSWEFESESFLLLFPWVLVLVSWCSFAFGCLFCIWLYFLLCFKSVAPWCVPSFGLFCLDYRHQPLDRVPPGSRFCCSCLMVHWGMAPQQSKSPMTPMIKCPTLQQK